MGMYWGTINLKAHTVALYSSRMGNQTESLQDVILRVLPSSPGELIIFFPSRTEDFHHPNEVVLHLFTFISVLSLASKGISLFSVEHILFL